MTTNQHGSMGNFGDASISMNTPSHDVNRVNKALEELGEHFDSVHIFATRHESGESGGTININKGVGNWFARYG